jgi:HSP20 family protein
VRVPGRRDIGRLQDELEELFAELWHGPRFAGARRGFRPRVDVFRTDDPPELTVVAELAGVDPAAVELVLLDQTLVLTGRRARPQPGGRPSYYQLEIEDGHFERRIALPDAVETDAVRAAYERGLLTVVLPIAERPPQDVRVSILVKGARQ